MVECREEKENTWKKGRKVKIGPFHALPPRRLPAHLQLNVLQESRVLVTVLLHLRTADRGSGRGSGLLFPVEWDQQRQGKGINASGKEGGEKQQTQER